MKFIKNWATLRKCYLKSWLRLTTLLERRNSTGRTRLLDAQRENMEMTEEHEVIEFELSKELKEKLRGVFYDTDSNFLNLYIKSEESKSSPLKCNVDKSSMKNTLEQFNEMVDGTLDQKIKLLCVYSIKYHLRRFVKFDTAEQKWYSENYPNDPVLIADKDKEQKSGSERSSTKIEKKKTIHVQRVYNKEIFAEAVLIAGVPKFLLATNGPDEISISTVDFIPLGKEDKIASPLPAESYINKPYTFNSQLELDATIEEAKKLTLDHLYGMVKRIWKKYIDADDFHISICAADTIFTYFQDKAGMTHYLFFVGGPGSGKSNNLEVFHFLAYRNLTSTGITSATLYRFYGGREEGIGTICEDEANDLDEE